MKNSIPFPAPVPTLESTPFWQAAQENRLVIQKCSACGRHQFYPRQFCTQCLSDQLDWVETIGTGTIHSFTICHVPGHPAMADRVPYVMALVDLPEGVRMLAEIQNAEPENVSIGDAVRVTFEHRPDGWVLPQFTPYHPSVTPGETP